MECREEEKIGGDGMGIAREDPSPLAFENDEVDAFHDAKVVDPAETIES